MLPLKSCYLVLVVVAISRLMVAQAIPEPSMNSDQFTDNSPDDKPNQDAVLLHKRPSFFVGSRYGRSGVSGSLFASSKTRRLNVVPRNDRFFLGSRYGKRAGEYMSAYEQDNLMAAAKAQNESTKSGANNNSNSNSNNTPYMMSCVYTGLRNFYRCSSVEEINNILNQLTTGQFEGDEAK